VQVLIFKLGDELFALRTEKVQSINETMNITRVPMAPGYIKGLVNLRGNVLSLLDINLLLDVPHGPEQQENVIILDLDSETIGISVDQVVEVIDMAEHLLAESPDVKHREYIEGILRFGDGIVTLLDMDVLCKKNQEH
jgi:purine-binding chemotaxis protein CheW